VVEMVAVAETEINNEIPIRKTCMLLILHKAV
jgi:hypothetical protein